MDQVIEKTLPATVALVKSRLTIILYPNTRCMCIALNDRKFNNEEYYHTRRAEAVGAEKELLDVCHQILGINHARTGKNEMHIDLGEGMLLREFIPPLVAAIREWGCKAGPYNPEIYLENRRYEVEPEYEDHGDWGKELSPGVKQKPGAVDIGMPYKIWKEGM